MKLNVNFSEPCVLVRRNGDIYFCMVYEGDKITGRYFRDAIPENFTSLTEFIEKYGSMRDGLVDDYDDTLSCLNATLRFIGGEEVSEAKGIYFRNPVSPLKYFREHPDIKQLIFDFIMYPD